MKKVSLFFAWSALVIGVAILLMALVAHVYWHILTGLSFVLLGLAYLSDLKKL